MQKWNSWTSVLDLYCFSPKGNDPGSVGAWWWGVPRIVRMLGLILSYLSNLRLLLEGSVQSSLGCHCRLPRFSSCVDSHLCSTLDFDLIVHVADFIQPPHFHAGPSHTKPNIMIPRNRIHRHPKYLDLMCRRTSGSKRYARSRPEGSNMGIDLPPRRR